MLSLASWALGNYVHVHPLGAESHLVMRDLFKSKHPIGLSEGPEFGLFQCSLGDFQLNKQHLQSHKGPGSSILTAARRRLVADVAEPSLQKLAVSGLCPAVVLFWFCCCLFLCFVFFLFFFFLPLWHSASIPL